MRRDLLCDLPNRESLNRCLNIHNIQNGNGVSNYIVYISNVGFQRMFLKYKMHLNCSHVSLFDLNSKCCRPYLKCWGSKDVLRTNVGSFASNVAFGI